MINEDKIATLNLHYIITSQMIRKEGKIMESLFIIYTPYQLLSALNIIKQYNEKNYKIILVHPNMKKFINLFYENKDNFVLLDNLYNQNNYRNKYFAHIKIVSGLVSQKKIIKDNIYLWKNVNRIYVPSDEIICRLIYKYVKLENREIVLNLIDDGNGTYVRKISDEKGMISKLFFSVFMDAGYFDKLNTIYCYHPELLKVNNQKVKIRKIQMNYEIVNCIKQQIKEASILYLNRKVIFLDQGKDDAYIKNSIKIVSKYFSDEEIIVKKHPRLESSISYNGFVISDDKLPIELILSILNVRDCLIISHSSTGNITPYLINNIMPWSIMLFKMDFDQNTINNEILNFIKEINGNIGYEYIRSPATLVEFEKILIKIKNEVKPITLM